MHTRLAAGIYYAKIADAYTRKSCENKHPKLYMEYLTIDDLFYMLEPLDKGYTPCKKDDEYRFKLEYHTGFHKNVGCKEGYSIDKLTIYTKYTKFTVEDNGNHLKINGVDIEFVDVGRIHPMAAEYMKVPPAREYYYARIRIHVRDTDFGFTVDLNRVNPKAFLNELEKRDIEIFKVLTDLYGNNERIELDALGVQFEIPQTGDYVDRINTLYDSNFKRGDRVFIDFRDDKIYYDEGDTR